MVGEALAQLLEVLQLVDHLIREEGVVEVPQLLVMQEVG